MKFVYFVKTLFPAFLFLRSLIQDSLHADHHMYVVLLAETPAEAARILSYFSCDMNDILQVFIKINNIRK